MAYLNRAKGAAVSFVVLLVGAFWGCASTPGRDRPLDPVMCTGFHPDGRTMVVSTSTSEVALFDVEPLRFRSLLTPDGAKGLTWKEARTRPGVTGIFRSPPVAFSPSGDLVVAANAAGEVVGWEVATGSVRFRAPGEGSMVDLAFFPDGQSFITVGPEARRWSAESGSIMGEFKLPIGAQGTAAGVSPDAKIVLVGLSSGEIAEFEAQTGLIARVLKDHSAAVTGIAFSPDGSVFASTAGRFDPRIWDLGEGPPLPRRPSNGGTVDDSMKEAGGATQALAFLAWMLGAARGFQVVGAPTLGASPGISPMLEKAAREPSPYCGPRVAFSADGRFLAATAHLSQLSGEFHLVLTDMVRKEGRVISGIYGCSVAFTPDSKFVVTGGLAAPQYWDTATGKRCDP